METKSYIIVQREFVKKCRCDHRKKPVESVILCVVNKFLETGCVHDNQVLVAAKRSTHTQSRQEKVHRLLAENPRTSITRLLQQLSVSWSTTYHIVWEDVRLFPYKVHVAQKLTPYSKDDRILHKISPWLLL